VAARHDGKGTDVYRAFRPLLAVTGAIASATAVLMSSTAIPTAPPAAAASPAVIRGDGSLSAVPGRYLVVLKDTASVRGQGVNARARALAGAHGAVPDQVWARALPGFATTMTRDQALRMAAEPDVAYVEQDQYRMAATGTAPTASGPAGPAPATAQTPVGWGLDRIDQHALPLDNHYAYDETAGQGVRVYILSTGIQVSHPDFGGRAAGGGNFVPDGKSSSTDCHGFGTRLAGLVGGALYGVAKKVSLVAVRITDCNGFITTTTRLTDGFEWIINNAVDPAVILYPVLDYCVDPSTHDPVPCPPGTAQSNVAAQEAAFAAGIAVVNMAGDSGQDTCSNASGAAPNTIHVGATASNDARAGFSNFGPCVTMFAPGAGVTTDDPVTGAYVFHSTAASAAYVAGTAALFLGKPEFAGASPGEIRDELVNGRSTPDVITGIGAGSPNRLLYTGPPGFFTVGDSAAMAPSGDGRLELFGATESARLFRREQLTAGAGAWTVWTQSATKGWLSVGAGAQADGRLALLGLTPSGQLWLREESASGSNAWYNWTRMSSTPNSDPVARAVMAHNLSNRLQLFTTTHQGKAYFRSQVSPGSKQWTAWTAFAFSGKLRSIAAVSRADGRVEVLATDDAGQVWRTAQTSPTDTTWSPFTKLTGFGMTMIAAARNADGRLELVGVDAGGRPWRRTRTTAGTWDAWTPLNPRTLSRVTAATNANGRIHIVGVDNLGNVWQSTQMAPNASTYSPWSPLDGLLRP
jgi:hypothetical protein